MCGAVKRHIATRLRWGGVGPTDGPADGAAITCHALNLNCQIVLGYKGSADALKDADIALKRAKRMPAEQEDFSSKTSKPVPGVALDQFALDGFSVSPVMLGKGQGSAVVHATGSISNMTCRQRFGVKVEVELYDAAGVKVGVASDYQKVVEAGAEWVYRALVVETKAASAKVITVNESVK